jgi:acyl dehydratase
VVTLAATIHNQNGELVLTAEQKILLRRREPQDAPP